MPLLPHVVKAHNTPNYQRRWVEPCLHLHTRLDDAVDDVSDDAGTAAGQFGMLSDLEQPTF
jgi:hypothetical protein